MSTEFPESEYVAALTMLVSELTIGSSPWGVNWKAFAEAFCPLCADKIPVVYFGDGSGYQGYMHRTSETCLTPCKAQACQQKLRRGN